ncbi:uncharacterized protein [Ptychodera flava]|uniref:uncharacterized protein n=1 Tax=Ptychodera flava TaxID=63121 RepID=UPI00396A3B3A
MTPANIMSAVSFGDVINADVNDDPGLRINEPQHRLEGDIAVVREPRVDGNHESNADAMPVNSTMDIESLYASIAEEDLEDNVYLKTGEVVWEFPRGNIFLRETLSEGRFCKTVKGEAWYIGGKDGTSEVIIKVAIGDTDDFKREIQAMKVLSKPIGVVQMLVVVQIKNQFT